jgi:hypothetical protein
MDRGEAILDAIQDDVAMRLNPNGEECWHCGGEGYTHDCVDGFCEDAEIGCEDCSRPCPECVLFKGQVAKAVREQVIKCNDVEVATAWLKSIGRWNDSITPERVRDELAKAATQPDLSKILGDALRKAQEQ